jgi:hypothetical protein
MRTHLSRVCVTASCCSCGASPAIADVAGELEAIPGSRHVILTGGDGSGEALVTADPVDDAVDQALEHVKQLGLPSEDVVCCGSAPLAPQWADVR